MRKEPNDALLDLLRAIQVEYGRRMRTGTIGVNGRFDFNAPFGGYKHSGNGREWDEYGFHEYLGTKSIVGQAGLRGIS
jgi:aldehyde dehydrogenase (NAD+)